MKGRIITVVIVLCVVTALLFVAFQPLSIYPYTVPIKVASKTVQGHSIPSYNVGYVKGMVSGWVNTIAPSHTGSQKISFNFEVDVAVYANSNHATYVEVINPLNPHIHIYVNGALRDTFNKAMVIHHTTYNSPWKSTVPVLIYISTLNPGDQVLMVVDIPFDIVRVVAPYTGLIRTTVTETVMCNNVVKATATVV
jgi:hypothetical protein